MRWGTSSAWTRTTSTGSATASPGGALPSPSAAPPPDPALVPSRLGPRSSVPSRPRTVSRHLAAPARPIPAERCGADRKTWCTASFWQPDIFLRCGQGERAQIRSRDGEQARCQSCDADRAAPVTRHALRRPTSATITAPMAHAHTDTRRMDRYTSLLRGVPVHSTCTCGSGRGTRAIRPRARCSSRPSAPTSRTPPCRHCRHRCRAPARRARHRAADCRR